MPLAPLWNDTVVGFAEIAKSLSGVTVTLTVTECERDPLVPVTVTV